MYVDDLCEGISTALAASVEPGAVYHLASGVETTIKELAERLISISGAHGQSLVFEPRRTGEVERNFADYELIKREFGFAPKYTLMRG